MPDFGAIVPVDLTEERKEEIEGIMAAANAVFADAAFVLYGADDPSDIRRLRDEYQSGTIPLTKFPGARRAFAELREIEAEVLGGYIRTTTKMCSSFELTGRETRPGVEFLDYITEAAWAIWDAMPVYNGQQRFTTFVYYCVKNRLTNFVRDEEQADGVSSTIRKFRKQVREVMRNRNMPLDDALTLVAEEENLQATVVERLRNAFALVHSLRNEADVEDGESGVDASERADENAAMRKAIENANLTAIERELVDAFLRGDRGYQARLEKEGRINPVTGNGYTRQALNQAFHRACTKCRAVLNGTAAPVPDDAVPVRPKERTSKQGKKKRHAA